jgi:hypothetical protein
MSFSDVLKQPTSVRAIAAAIRRVRIPGLLTVA